MSILWVGRGGKSVRGGGRKSSRVKRKNKSCPIFTRKRLLSEKKGEKRFRRGIFEENDREKERK